MGEAKEILIIVISCFSLIFGAVQCFAGYKLFKPIMFLGGVLLVAGLIFSSVYIMSGNLMLSVAVAIPFGIAEIFLQKHVYIVASSFSGAGIMLFFIFKLLGETMWDDKKMLWAVLWLPICIFGVVCQHMVCIERPDEDNDFREVYSCFEKTPLAHEEKQHPEMQRAYRNYCINCGYALGGKTGACPRCGFSL